MATIVCPKCRAQGDGGHSCPGCGINFAEYEQQKQQDIAAVYALIGGGEFNESKKKAEQLMIDFPDGKGEFILLLSNINRDINIQEKYNQASLLFKQGKFDDVALVLRNIRAFDPTLEEKIISLRKKAARHTEHDDMFSVAVEKFTAGRFAKSKKLFQAIHDPDKQQQIQPYLQKIQHKQDELLRQAAQCLQDNLYDAALNSFSKLHSEFPETVETTREIMALLEKKQKIKEELLTAAQEAKEAGRGMEAKALYSFISWQYPEFRPRMDSHLDDTLSQIIVSLADIADKETTHFARLGLQLDDHGLFTAKNNEEQAGMKRATDQTGLFIPLQESPDPKPDTPSKPVNLADQQVSDFTC
jgi:tetratricopeptide (TPR) repeat protein